METLIPLWMTYLIILIYAGIMFAIVNLFTVHEREHARENYFVADRKLPIFRGAASMAVSWIWAPAIFFCAVKSYTQGLPGAFWFIVPNILCFVTFAIIAKAMREGDNEAISLPDYMLRRFDGDSRPHIASLIVVMCIDVVALLFNAFVGAFLLNLMSGIPIYLGIIIMMGVAISYSAWRGLPASVVTDVVQLIVIFVIAFIITPWAIFAAGGFNSVLSGIGGFSGNYTNLFNAEVFYSFGIPGSLALLFVPLADQMFYQRAMACPTRTLMPTFVLGGLLFGLVPIVLSLFGFIAASPPMQVFLENRQFPIILVNVEVVKFYLPAWTLISFIVMAICALSSTLDSALCAIGSLWGQDIYKRYVNPNASDAKNLKVTKNSVIFIGLAVTVLAIILRNQLNGDVLFNFNGVVASSVVPAVIASVYLKNISASAAALGIIVALIVGIPLGWWANVGYHVNGNSEMIHYVILAAVGTPLLSFLTTYITSYFLKKQNFK